jgi:hypothetical protein
MHNYLAVQCKTIGCPAVIYLLHFEAPDTPDFQFVYPGFALKCECSLCKQIHRYEMRDAELRRLPTPMHKQGWKPPLPYPPPKDPESN